MLVGRHDRRKDAPRQEPYCECYQWCHTLYRCGYGLRVRWDRHISFLCDYQKILILLVHQATLAKLRVAGYLLPDIQVVRTRDLFDTAPHHSAILIQSVKQYSQHCKVARYTTQYKIDIHILLLNKHRTNDQSGKCVLWREVRQHFALYYRYYKYARHEMAGWCVYYVPLIKLIFIYYMKSLSSIQTRLLAGVLAIVLVLGMSVLYGTIASAAGADTREAVLITFSDTPGPAEHALVRAHGGDISHSFTIVPTIAATLPTRAIDALQRNPHIDLIEPDVTVTLIEPAAITESQLAAELSNTWGVEHIGSGVAHIDGIMGGGVRVAVHDTGIDYTHQELAGIYAGGFNTFTGTNDAMDDNGHGTHVAGTIAAARDGVEVVGVAPEVALYGVKVLDADGFGSASTIIAGLEWAIEAGIQVANHSYSSSGDPGVAMRNAFETSMEAGMLHIAAAGNTGRANGRGPNTVGYPAAYDSVVAVAATDENDERARFSSHGPAVELAAPGVNILSTYPDNHYMTANGTSMASPHVAGVAALVRGLDTALSVAQVRAILNESAIPLGSSHWYGSGLVDVPGAVALTLPEEEPTEPEEPIEEDPNDPTPPEEDPDATTMSIGGIEYSTNGGRQGDRHLNVHISAVANDAPLANAYIEATVNRGGSEYATLSGTTDSNGVLSTTFNNAPSGTYTTKITAMTLDGYEWDGNYPNKLFDK